MDPEDREWPAQLVEFLPYLRGLARRHTARDDSDDLVQAVALKVLHSPPSNRRHVRAWLRRIVLHTAIDFARMRRQELAHSEELEDLAACTDAVEDDPAQLPCSVEEVLQALSQEHQLVFRLYYGEGLTFAEIAKRTGIADTTCRRRYAGAMRYLRLRLGNDRPLVQRLGAWCGSVLQNACRKLSASSIAGKYVAPYVAVGLLLFATPRTQPSESTLVVSADGKAAASLSDDQQIAISEARISEMMGLLSRKPLYHKSSPDHSGKEGPDLDAQIEGGGDKAVSRPILAEQRDPRKHLFASPSR